MHAVALKLLVQSGEYETETREWSKLTDNQQTWTECKATFREAYVEKRHAEASREGEENYFDGPAVIGGSVVKGKTGNYGGEGIQRPRGQPR